MILKRRHRGGNSNMLDLQFKLTTCGKFYIQEQSFLNQKEMLRILDICFLQIALIKAE